MHRVHWSYPQGTDTLCSVCWGALSVYVCALINNALSWCSNVAPPLCNKPITTNQRIECNANSQSTQHLVLMFLHLEVICVLNIMKKTAGVLMYPHSLRFAIAEPIIVLTYLFACKRSIPLKALLISTCQSVNTNTKQEVYCDSFSSSYSFFWLCRAISFVQIVQTLGRAAFGHQTQTAQTS